MSIPEFTNLDEMYMDAAIQVRDEGLMTGSRDGETKEILGYAARLTDPRAHFLFNPVRRLSPAYAAAELLWYLSGESDIERIKAYAPKSYPRFVSGSKDDGVNANGAYGRRIGSTEFYDAHTFHEPLDSRNAGLMDKKHGHSPSLSQLYGILRLLEEKQETRQAVISLWRPEDLASAIHGGHNDLPCTLVLHFIARDGRLNLCTKMRSNDLWLGFPYDIFCFTSLQILLADVLDLDLGFYQHEATSLHIYSRNYEAAMEAAEPPAFNTGPMDYAPARRPVFRSIGKAVKLEEHNRKSHACANSIPVDVGENSLLSQLLIMSAIHWTKDKRHVSLLHNPLMRKYYESFLCL